VVLVAVVATGAEHAPKGDYHTRRILGWSTHNVADFAALELKAISSMSKLGFPRVARMIIQCIAIFGLLVSCSIMFCGDLRRPA